jgi:hypothetical protein
MTDGLAVFDSRKEIEKYFLKLWQPFLDINGEINENILIGKTILYTGSSKYNSGSGILKRIFLKKRYIGNKKDKILILDNDAEIPVTLCKIVLFNPVINKEEKIILKKLLEQKYYANQKVFKSLYYATKEYQEKLKVANIKNNGENYIAKSRAKASETIMKKYGVPYFLCRGEHYDNAIGTIMLEKFGTVTPMKNEEIKNKISATIKQRYGVDWFLERGEHYKKIENILLEKLGVTNPFLSEEIRAKALRKKLTSEEWLEAREFFKNKRIQEKLLKRTKKVNRSCSNFELEVINFLLENVSFKQPYFYDLHSDTQQFLVKSNYVSKKYYKVDFYDKELNLVIEIQGDYWHASPYIFKENDKIKFQSSTVLAKEIWERDRKRKQEIINTLNCDYIEIWEGRFKEDKEKIINQINYVIESKKNKEN